MNNGCVEDQGILEKLVEVSKDQIRNRNYISNVNPLQSKAGLTLCHLQCPNWWVFFFDC